MRLPYDLVALAVTLGLLSLAVGDTRSRRIATAGEGWIVHGWLLYPVAGTWTKHRYRRRDSRMDGGTGFIRILLDCDAVQSEIATLIPDFILARDPEMSTPTQKGNSHGLSLRIS